MQLQFGEQGHVVVQDGKRSDLHRFVVLPKRWLVERTIAWLNRCRRLAKDWENRSHNALAFLRLASIHLMLPQSTSCFGDYAIQHEPSGQTLTDVELCPLSGSQPTL